MYLQFTILSICMIVSCLENNFLGLLCLFRWYVLHTTKSDVDRTPINGSVSYTYVSCRLYLLTRCLSTWCILYMVEFSCGFPGEAGLILIPHSCYIKLLLNSWPSNYPPRSYMISTGHGYWNSHVVSTKFAILIDFLSLYCNTTNHAITGSIVVRVLILSSLSHLYIILGAYEIYT